jgi:3-methyladenine DNA glycosylase AlkC
MTNLELAHDPNTTLEILQDLATDDDRWVRCWVAQNPNTTLEILKSLATDDDSVVRYWAAHNPNATELVRRLYLMTEAKVS